VDDIVRQAMAKWPNVPAAYGWLALSRRGNWLLKGEAIANTQITDFINRNYLHDEAGRWFFQNGPQRVFVELAYAPFVYLVLDQSAPQDLFTHTRLPVREVRGAWLDGQGTLLLLTEHGIGHVHDQDLEILLSCFVDEGGAAIDEDTLEARLDALVAGAEAALWFHHGAGRVSVLPLKTAAVAATFHFDPRPRDND
jgi:hypothetical protein